MPRKRSKTPIQSMQSQIDRLTQMVSNIASPRRARSRSRRPRTPSRRVEAPASTSMVEMRGARPKSRARNNPQTSRFAQTGSLVFSNKELFSTITIKKGDSKVGGAILIQPSSCKFLAKLGSLFGRYRWISLAMEWESMVSTSTDGVMAYGFDWSCKAITEGPDATNLATATSLYPSISHPIWSSDQRLPPVPRQRLNARLWYDGDSTVAENSSVAAFYYYLSSVVSSGDKTYGSVWISYTVELQGPHV